MDNATVKEEVKNNEQDYDYEECEGCYYWDWNKGCSDSECCPVTRGCM